MGHENYLKICLLKNGDKKVYAMCDEEKNAYDEFPVFKHLKYLGKGDIYSIDGTRQHGKSMKNLHFWEKIKEEKI